ncbi:MAG: DUF1801 domain-containing protein [Paracoccaceae bacterium]|nr:DUF1801 domain-containing protein [Paracoccaceae bacterium]
MVTIPADTPEEYLAALASDWRRDKLLDIRAAIFAAAPHWVETISYRMLGYGPEGTALIHLNAQKGFVGLYLGDISALDPGGVLTQGMSRGKGCLRFRKRDDVGEKCAALLHNFVRLARSGQVPDC